MSKRVGKLSKEGTLKCGWQEALEQFLFWKQAQSLSPMTIKGYRETISAYFNRNSQSWQNSNFKSSVLNYMAQDIKPATYNIRLIYLRGFFQWCIDENYLIENPLKGFKQRKAQPRIVNISEEILEKLLTLPDQTTFAGLRDYALILVTLDTGIRPKEALNLKPEDFDFKQHSIIVPCEEAKTRISRFLPVVGLTAKAIQKLITVRDSSWSAGVPIFCSNEGTTLTRHTWGDRMEFYSNKLGVKIRPYDLRHCFALYYLRNGGNAFALQKTLGHTDMSMTKRYISLTGQDLRETHNIASPLNNLVKKRSRVVKV